MRGGVAGFVAWPTIVTSASRTDDGSKSGLSRPRKVYRVFGPVRGQSGPRSRFGTCTGIGMAWALSTRAGGATGRARAEAGGAGGRQRAGHRAGGVTRPGGHAAAGTRSGSGPARAVYSTGWRTRRAVRPGGPVHLRGGADTGGRCGRVRGEGLPRPRNRNTVVPSTSQLVRKRRARRCSGVNSTVLRATSRSRPGARWGLVVRRERERAEDAADNDPCVVLAEHPVS